MPKTLAIILSIVIITFLLASYFIFYIINKKTPVPKGCEDLIDKEKCAGCNNTLCHYYKEKEEEKK